MNLTILVTGATSGFGRAIAVSCVKAGARVIATGRRGERLAELKNELGESLHTVTLDVRDREAVNAAFAALPPEFAQVDVLVNNAGLALGMASLEQLAHEDAEQMIATNVNGMVYCTQALLPGMIARAKTHKIGGHIVNIGSTAGNYPYPGGNVYGGTKAFVKQFSLNLRADLLGKNIRVTNIEPALAETEFSEVRFHGDKEKAKALYANVIALSAEDVAEAVLWCITRPAHVNINRMEIMPTSQAFGPLAVAKNA